MSAIHSYPFSWEELTFIFLLDLTQVLPYRHSPVHDTTDGDTPARP